MGFHKIPGIGIGFVPFVYDPSPMDQVLHIGDNSAGIMARRLTGEETPLVDIFSGAAVLATLQVVPVWSTQETPPLSSCRTSANLLFALAVGRVIQNPRLYVAA